MMSTVLERSSSRKKEVSGLMAQKWRSAGLCKGSDPLIFYPPSEDDDSLAGALVQAVGGDADFSGHEAALPVGK